MSIDLFGDFGLRTGYRAIDRMFYVRDGKCVVRMGKAEAAYKVAKMRQQGARVGHGLVRIKTT